MENLTHSSYTNSKRKPESHEQFLSLFSRYYTAVNWGNDIVKQSLFLPSGKTLRKKFMENGQH